jgi:hypothetical protein
VYAKVGCIAGSGAAGCTALAWTGFDALSYAVAGSTLLFAGLAVLKLVPRRAPRAPR